MKKFIACVLLTIAPFAQSQTDKVLVDEAPSGKKGLDYVAMYGTVLESRSYETERPQMMGTQVALGTYITDYVRLEMRFGVGLQGDDIAPGFEVQTDYWASWFMGGQYPLTEYSNAYAMFGFSTVKGDASPPAVAKGERNPYADVDPDYYTNSFSVGWLFGIDYLLIDSTYLVMEAGKLHRDTSLDMNTYQASIGLRYEF